MSVGIEPLLRTSFAVNGRPGTQWRRDARSRPKPILIRCGVGRETWGDGRRERRDERDGDETKHTGGRRKWQRARKTDENGIQ